MLGAIWLYVNSTLQYVCCEYQLSHLLGRCRSNLGKTFCHRKGLKCINSSSQAFLFSDTRIQYKNHCSVRSLFLCTLLYFQAVVKGKLVANGNEVTEKIEKGILGPQS